MSWIHCLTSALSPLECQWRDITLFSLSHCTSASWATTAQSAAPSGWCRCCEAAEALSQSVQYCVNSHQTDKNWPRAILLWARTWLQPFSLCLNQNKMRGQTVLALGILLTSWLHPSLSGISFRNVRRSPVIYRLPPTNKLQLNNDRIHSEVDDSDDSKEHHHHHPPRYRRRRPPFHERILNSFTGLLPRLPSFNIIKRSGGFHRFRRPAAPPEQTITESEDLRRVKRVNHRIGENTEESTEDKFHKQINKFRIGLMVHDPRGNFYKSPTLHETRNDDFERNNLETDVRKNVLYRNEMSKRRRRPPGPPDSGPNISSYPGPPYPGPNPRNPRLPLDKTIIYP